MNTGAHICSVALGRTDDLRFNGGAAPAGGASGASTGGAALSVRTGDKVTIHLGYHTDLTQVFSGEVDEIIPGIDALVVNALTSDRHLLTLRYNQIYERQSAGNIVRNLASRANVSTGTIDNGVDFPLYAVDDGKNGYEHILELAKKCGYECFVDTTGALMFREAAQGPVAKTFEYGFDILKARIFRHESAIQKVEVRGESPASSLGNEKAHWLVKSFEQSLGIAGTGKPIRNVQDLTIKTKAAADTVAAARLDQLNARITRGHLTVLGVPAIMLGDSIKLTEMPEPDLNGTYKVRAIQHKFTREDGFLSEVAVQGVADGSPGGGIGG